MDSTSSSSSALQSSSYVTAEPSEKRRERTDFVVHKRACPASKTAMQEEERLRKHRLRNRAKRASPTEEQREAILLRKCELHSEIHQREAKLVCTW